MLYLLKIGFKKADNIKDLMIKGTKNGLLFDNNYLGGNTGHTRKMAGLKTPVLPKALQPKNFIQMDHFSDIFGKVIADFDQEDVEEPSVKKKVSNNTQRIESSNQFGSKWEIERNTVPANKTSKNKFKINTNQKFENLIRPQNKLESAKETNRITCKDCNTFLLTRDNIKTHKGKIGIGCDSFFIQPQDWIKEFNGFIKCHNKACNSKIGEIGEHGVSCNCGETDLLYSYLNQLYRPKLHYDKINIEAPKIQRAPLNELTGNTKQYGN